MINVNVIVRKVRYAKKIIFGIMLHVIVKIEKIYQVLWMIQRLHMMEI